MGQCDHGPIQHKKVWKKIKEVEANKETPQKQSVKATMLTTKQLSAETTKKEVTPEPYHEDLENEWGEEFTNKLKECVAEQFDYEKQAILPGKYLLHYLKKRIGFDFTGQTQHRDALQFVCVEQFGWKAINEWGYSIRVL